MQVSHTILYTPAKWHITGELSLETSGTKPA